MSFASTAEHLTVMSFERTFKSDSIEVTDNFLMAVESKLRDLAPDAANPLECYLYINNQVRAANVQALREIAAGKVVYANPEYLNGTKEDFKPIPDSSEFIGDEEYIE